MNSVTPKVTHKAAFICELPPSAEEGPPARGESMALVSAQSLGGLRHPALRKGCVGTETDVENRKTLFALTIPILSFPAFPTLASFLFSPFQAPQTVYHQLVSQPRSSLQT